MMCCVREATHDAATTAYPSIAELSNRGSVTAAKISWVTNLPDALLTDTRSDGNGPTFSRIRASASSSVIMNPGPVDEYPPTPYSRNLLVRWLSGRKQRFAKAPYPKRVPRVRIPPSPPFSPDGKNCFAFGGANARSPAVDQRNRSAGVGVVSSSGFGVGLLSASGVGSAFGFGVEAGFLDALFVFLSALRSGIFSTYIRRWSRLPV